MTVAAIVSAVLAVLFLVLYFLQREQARRLAAQLHKLNNEQRTQIVTMSFPSRVNQDLVREINCFLLARQHTEQEWRAEELRLQEAVSNISHDMRTPLTAILGYIHLINTGELSAEERDKYLHIIERRAKSLQKLILDFYDISRMDEGCYQMQIEPADVNACCLEVLAEVYDDFEKHNISVEANLLSNPVSVNADMAAVQRIYENIFQNVIKHGSKRISVSGALENGDYILLVSNDCPYMSAGQIDRVFDRSFTASKSRTDGSTGLGLAICRSLIEKMGHSITAYYENGVFTIKITYHIT